LIQAFPDHDIRVLQNALQQAKGDLESAERLLNVSVKRSKQTQVFMSQMPDFDTPWPSTQQQSSSVTVSVDSNDSDTVYTHQLGNDKMFMFANNPFDPKPQETQRPVDPFSSALASEAAAKIANKKVGSPVSRNEPTKEPVPSVTKKPTPAPVVYDTSKKYSLEELQKGVPGVDKNKREDWLSDADFESIFAMKRDAFAKIPEWKRNNIKRDHKLF